MKKRVLLLLALSIGFGIKLAFSQNREAQLPFARNIHFRFSVSPKKTNRQDIINYNAPDSEVYRVFDYAKSSIYSRLSNVSPNTPIMLGVKLGPHVNSYESQPVKSFSKSYASYMISDSSGAVVIALGITKNNVNDYRYHVVENDSIELVHWSVPQLQQHYGAKQPYGFIGKFNDPGKQLLVEVVNIKNYAIRDGVVFNWRVNFKPVVTNIIVRTKASSFSSLFSLIRNIFDPGPANEVNTFDPSLYRTIKPYSKISVYNNNTIVLFLKELEPIPYAIYLVNTDGKNSGYYVENDIIADNYTIDMSAYQPGKYQIVMGRQLRGGYRDTTQEI